MASIDARDNQEAHLIDEIGLEERPVNAAASFEKKSADSELLSELVHGISEIDRETGKNRGLPGRRGSSWSR